MHLTGPRRLSINDGIDLEKYKQIDNAIAFMKQTEHGCYMAKKALKHMPFVCTQSVERIGTY